MQPETVHGDHHLRVAQPQQYSGDVKANMHALITHLEQD